MGNVNPWRGEREIAAQLSDGTMLTSTLSASHAEIVAAMQAVNVSSLSDLRTVLATLDPSKLIAVCNVLERVDGALPEDVVKSARGASGYDAIADALIGLIMGQTEEEQAMEKKLYADQQSAMSSALMQAALAPMVGQLADILEIRLTEKASKGPLTS